MERFNHLALGSPDVEETANFYKEVFGLVETERYYGGSRKSAGAGVTLLESANSPYRLEAGDIPPPNEKARQVYLSDGYMNLTIAGALSPGIAHIGFVVDDVGKLWERLEACSIKPARPLERSRSKGTHEFQMWDPLEECEKIDIAKHGSGPPDDTSFTRRTRAGVRGKIRHIAYGVPDVVKLAAFYQDVFGLDEVDRQQEPGPEGGSPPEMVKSVSLSDGHVNFIIGHFSVVGLDHFGFVVDDLEETIARLEAAGAERVSEKGQGNVRSQGQQKYHGGDVKYKGPQDVIIDLSERGWSH